MVTLFESLLPRGTCLHLLLTVEPRTVRPADPNDYFVTERPAGPILTDRS